MSNTYNKDFYSKMSMPHRMRTDFFIRMYGDRSWFPNSFETYRQMILNAEDPEKVIPPSAFFDREVRKHEKR